MSVPSPKAHTVTLLQSLLQTILYSEATVILNKSLVSLTHAGLPPISRQQFQLLQALASLSWPQKETQLNLVTNGCVILFPFIAYLCS